VSDTNVTQKNEGIGFYASSNPLMASLIPSAPRAKVPYGNLDEPDMLLSSDTRSDSSLRTQTQRADMSNGKGKIANRSTEKTRAIRPTARILLLTILRRSAASGDGGSGGRTTDSSSELSMSSSCEHVFSTATSISVTCSENSRELAMLQQKSLKGAHSSRQQTVDSR
jgi:hypothetical protein